MRHTIRGQKWTQTSKRLKGYWGWCKISERVIEIGKGQTGSRLLETLIHEWLHAQFPMLDEDTVDEAGKDGLRFLEKNGVGFVEECQCGNTTTSELTKDSGSRGSPRKTPTTKRKSTKNPSTKSKASRRKPGSRSKDG